MNDTNFKKLKSGTDIRGTAVGESYDLTDEIISKIAMAFAILLSEKANKKIENLSVAVGRDSRVSGPRIRDVIIKTLTSIGIKVYDCSLASTPAMFMSTIDIPCDGAIQITASHHPYDRNGLKFFTPEGGFESEDITRLLEYAQTRTAEEAEGSVTAVDYMSDYANRLCEVVRRGADGEFPLEGFHIIVDAGNGVGGFYAEKVLKTLGADISGSQFLEPDGYFPNHTPNPEDAKAMESICHATMAAKADLGIIFDTDVDRAGCVDSTGKEINRNRLIALAAAIALEDNKGGTIVTDSITSGGLKIFIEEELKAKHCRFKRGYKNVINEAKRLNDTGINAPLAIETSGHAALRDNYFLDDGAYLMTQIIIKAAKLKKQGKTINDITKNLKEPAETLELRFNILTQDFKSYGEKVINGLEDYAKDGGWQIAQDSREGIRISFPKGEGDGWLLLRLSVHDPNMPLNIESDEIGGTKTIARKLAGYLLQCEQLDTTPIKNI